MHILKSTEEIAAFCLRATQFPYVTVDTEFLRERTYYSKLCLIQMALPSDDPAAAVIIDPLAADTSLQAVFDLMADTSVVKVFHAARQDVEIFYVDGGVIPTPMFDTQVAAMVCGFGDQVGYETLVRKVAKTNLDKTSRFTDWSRRPLTDAQLKYALADVTHLRVIYETLSAQVNASGRASWLDEEMSTLSAPETYRVRPDEAWKRVKTRTNSGKFLSVVKHLAEFRENLAQRRNIPRNRVFKDDALLELASTKPKTTQDLGRSRLLLREARRGDVADGILAAIEAGATADPATFPKPTKSKEQLQVDPALADLLRVLLKAKSESEGVAQKLIASAAELDQIAAGRRDVKALSGWRAEVFGSDAIRLCDGEVALTAKNGNVKVIATRA